MQSLRLLSHSLWVLRLRGDLTARSVVVEREEEDEEDGGGLGTLPRMIFRRGTGVDRAVVGTGSTCVRDEGQWGDGGGDGGKGVEVKLELVVDVLHVLLVWHGWALWLIKDARSVGIKADVPVEC